MSSQPTTQFELFFYNMLLVQGAFLYNLLSTSGSHDLSPTQAPHDLSFVKAYVDALWPYLPDTIYT